MPETRPSSTVTAHAGKRPTRIRNLAYLITGYVSDTERRLKPFDIDQLGQKVREIGRAHV